jgi:hypothetical protein
MQIMDWLRRCREVDGMREEGAGIQSFQQIPRGGAIKNACREAGVEKIVHTEQPLESRCLLLGLCVLVQSTGGTGGGQRTLGSSTEGPGNHR